MVSNILYCKDFYVIWSCYRCDKLNQQSFDLNKDFNDVNTLCRYCKARHTVELSYENQWNLDFRNKATLDESENFQHRGLQQFINSILPDKDIIKKDINLLKNSLSHELTEDDVVNAWCQHDSLHYLFNQSFTNEGESKVAFLEKTFNCGFYPHGEKYNSFHNRYTYCDWDHITRDKIMETAELIKQYI